MGAVLHPANSSSKHNDAARCFIFSYSENRRWLNILSGQKPGFFRKPGFYGSCRAFSGECPRSGQKANGKKRNLHAECLHNLGESWNLERRPSMHAGLAYSLQNERADSGEPFPCASPGMTASMVDY
jgi:hypothetical protein